MARCKIKQRRRLYVAWKRRLSNATLTERVRPMKKRAFLLLVMLVAMTGTGCVAHINEMMESWKGHNISELIASWGPPQQIIDVGDEGKIYVWAKVRSFTSPGTATTTTTENATAFGNTAFGSAQSTT